MTSISIPPSKVCSNREWSTWLSKVDTTIKSKTWQLIKPNSNLIYLSLNVQIRTAYTHTFVKTTYRLMKVWLLKCGKIDKITTWKTTIRLTWANILTRGEACRRWSEITSVWERCQRRMVNSKRTIMLRRLGQGSAPSSCRFPGLQILANQ